MGLRAKVTTAVAAMALGVAGLSFGGPTASAAAPAEVTTIRVGPFLLPPAPLGERHVNHVIPSVEKPCEDCFITAIEPDLVYADGSRADMNSGVMLHHLVIQEPGVVRNER